jgi:hypothetical protein
MQKIAINVCFGGFSLSRVAAEYMAASGSEAAAQALASGGRDWHWGGPCERDDPHMVAAIERLGDAANTVARLLVVEVPDSVEWTIEEYDGFEHVAESHRTWP